MTEEPRTLTEKEIVCPMCYLATKVVCMTEPRTPAPGNRWLCKECNEVSVFDDNLDLRMATDAEKVAVASDLMAVRR